MEREPRQLVLDLPHLSALDAEDFLVSRSNQAAVDLISSPGEWPHGAAMVVGPAGAGKSHLAHVWQLGSGAAVAAASTIGEDAAAALARQGAIVVEDLDRGIASEQALFHLLNLARQGQGRVLMTSRAAPGDLDVSLPDLRSRLRGLPVAAIEPPDDALLQSVLVKLFGDRQLPVEPQVVSYLVLRMERSMAAAQAIVAELDRLALALRRKISRPLAQQVLARIGGGGQSDEAFHEGAEAENDGGDGGGGD